MRLLAYVLAGVMMQVPEASCQVLMGTRSVPQIVVSESYVLPAAVTTLEAYAADTGSVSLRWVAVGNDSLTGQAASYDVRYGLLNITDDNWAVTTQATGEPLPRTASAYDSLTITGLASGTQYYFALKVSDDTSGVSAISNVAVATTDTAASFSPGYPSAIASLAVDSASAGSLFLSWSATGDDANVGTATSYDLRYSTRKASTGELITNGALTVSTAGWQLVNDGGDLSWSDAGGRSGGALRLVNTSSYSGVVFPIANTDADSATVSMWIYASAQDTIDLYVLDQNNGLIGSSSQRIIPAATWTQVTRTVAITGAQTQIRPGFNFDPGVANNVVLVDDASCTVGVAWSALTQAAGEPSPSVAGSLEHFTLSGLSANTRYYAAVKATDDSAHTSDLSNVVSAVTSTAAAAPDTADTTKIWAGKYHVKVGGSDAASGLSYASAWATVSKANTTADYGDTVLFYAGSYSGNMSPLNSGTATQPIVFSAYGADVVTITGDATAGSGNSFDIGTDYVRVERIRFIDDARASTAATWYWGLVRGDHVTLKRIQMLDDQDTSAYVTGGKHGRLLYISSNYVTVERSRFTGGSEGILIDGPAPRYYLLDHDTIGGQGYNNIILGGGAAVPGIYHAGVVQRCVLGPAGEDNLQLQNNGTPSDLANSGILIWLNKMSEAKENCIDVKATGATVCIEDNDLVMSYGNDTNEDNGGASNDNGGAGIELGAGDYSEHVITRFNRIAFNHSGSKLYGGGHFYNNTVVANNHSYRGVRDTSQAFYGLTTDGLGEAGYKRVLNNIFAQHSYWSVGGEVLLKKAGGTDFELNNNLYWQDGGSARFGTNITGLPDELFYVGIGPWQTALNAPAFEGWEGWDLASQESSPMFVNVPSPLLAWSDTLDFTISSGSPAKAAGKALTLATNSGTNSTSLEVEDPYYFRTDYGIGGFYSGVTGDTLQIGAEAPVAITAIDYPGRIITLSAQRSWANGAAVTLRRNGLTVDDIGAKQIAN